MASVAPETSRSANPTQPASAADRTDRSSAPDVVVVGAGFAGLYMLHKLRTLGFSARGVEVADDVGGTWYWNRYPGARCDITTADYAYSFDPELESAWSWSEKYATQPEILRYAQFVAERYDLKRDIDFGTRVDQARWDDATGRWHIHTTRDETLTPRFYIMASGVLSAPKEPDIPGAGSFKGEVYSTSRWPHGGVDFSGKRVAVIGTGSSGIQCIPMIAQQAAQLTVFQRTPNYSVPARNGQVAPERLQQLNADRAAYRQAAKLSRAGVPMPLNMVYGRYAPPELRAQLLNQGWESGELVAAISIFADQGLFEDSNELVCEFVRDKIRAAVKDPATAEALCPKDHPFGTKRPCLDTGYYETYNRPNVRLVDLKRTPIEAITASGIDVGGESLPFDAIVYATGFDAMTGPLVAVDIAGRGGQTLKHKWSDGPKSYLGLMTTGFPNFFTITGSAEPVGAVEHDGVDRTARRLDRRLPVPPAAARRRRDRTHRHRRSRMDAALRRLRRDHAAPTRQLLVHGLQRARQAPRAAAVHRRRRCLPQGVRRGGRARLSRLHAERARCLGRPFERGRRDPSPATRRADGAGDDGGAEPADLRFAAA